MSCPPRIRVFMLVFAAIAGLGAGCGNAKPSAAHALWLSDFETADEQAIRWKIYNVMAQRTTEHATHGGSSVKLIFRDQEVSPFVDTDTPQFVMDAYLAHDGARRNWSRYDALEFDLFNAQPLQERLILEVKDRQGRIYTEDLVVNGNASQHVSIRVSNIKKALDVSQIVQLRFFRWPRERECTFYLDALYLEPSAAPARTGVEPARPVSAARGIKPIDAWQVGWAPGTVKLLRDPAKFQGHASNPVQISLARGEYESAQLALIGGSKSARITIAVGPLTRAGGTEQIPPGHIQIRRVDYVKTRKPDYPVSFVGEWPDPLPLASAVDVPAKQVQPIWLTIGAHEKLPAGRYDGTVTLTDAEGHTKTVALQVTVWNFTLPKTAHLKTAFDFYRFRLEKAYRETVKGGEQWRDRMDELEQRYFLDMLRHRINPVWSADPTMPKFAWDVKRYLDRGLGVFGIGTHGGNNDNNWPQDPVELAQTMTWYRQAVMELKLLRLLDRAYVYAFDEPSPGDPRVPQILAALHHEAPDLKTLLVMHEAPDPMQHAAWLKDADIVCLRITAFDPDQVKQFKQQGKEIWMYVSSPEHPYPTFVIDYPAMASRIIPWMAWKYGATGLLYWCVNFWNGDPMENPASFSADQNGNGFLFYPSADGPVPSIRLEAIRDGIEDYEYLYRLQELIQLARTKGGVDPTLLAQAERLVAVDPTLVSSLRSYAQDPEVLFVQRAAIAEMIEKLQ